MARRVILSYRTIPHINRVWYVLVWVLTTHTRHTSYISYMSYMSCMSCDTSDIYDMIHTSLNGMPRHVIIAQYFPRVGDASSGVFPLAIRPRVLLSAACLVN